MLSSRGLVGLRFKVSRDVRCTGKATPPNRNATPKLVSNVSLMCKITNIVKAEKNASVEFSRKWLTKLSKKPAITTPHTYGNVPRKWSNKEKNPNELQNDLPVFCSRTAEKRNSLSHAARGFPKRNRTHIAFLISQPHFDIIQASARLDSLLAVHSQGQKFTQRVTI